MRECYFLNIAGAACLLVGASACTPPELTPEEKAEIQARLERSRAATLAQDIAGFPETATRALERLESLGPDDVRTMEDSAAVWRVFDEVARNIRIVESAKAEGKAPVSDDALKAAASLKPVLIAKQRQLFPEMRRAFASYMSDQVAGLQTNYRAVGSRARLLRAASPMFSSQETVMEAHMSVLLHARRFRFDKAEYVYSLTGASYTVEIGGEDDGDIDG